MTLDTDEFIRRFLLHVLPGGFHRIRHYGLFANGGRAENIARARELLNVPAPLPPAMPPAAPTITARTRASLPLLRRPHDHHRDLRARLAPRHRSDRVPMGRHLMIAVARSRRPRPLVFRRRWTGDAKGLAIAHRAASDHAPHAARLHLGDCCRVLFRCDPTPHARP